MEFDVGYILVMELVVQNYCIRQNFTKSIFFISFRAKYNSILMMFFHTWVH
jgi:hypothetical protein